MSILQKKLDLKPELPDHIKDSVALWSSLHSVFCDNFSELSQSSWEVARAEIKVAPIVELISGLPKQGLYFGYGEKEGQTSYITYYDEAFAEKVTKSALDIQKTEVNEAHKMGKLDLILFKPVADSLNVEFWKMFNDIYIFKGIDEDVPRDPKSPLNEIGRGLSSDDIGLVTDSAAWIEMALYIQPVKNKAEKSKPKDNKASSLAVRILLPQNLLLKLLSVRGNQTNEQVIDPQNPWTLHMRKSLDTAIVPVRVVAETCRMTVADCTRLEIGQVISLPGVSLDSIGIEAEMSGVSVNFAWAALGIYKAHRAVKLIDNIDPNFCPDTISV
ncbi:MAG: hypothetical protein ABJ275_02345 [Maricaulaceae bacterium]